MNPQSASPRRALVQALAAVVLLLGAILAVFTPAYQQNDDVVMEMIASGRGLALQGDAHLVYVNVLLGELLRRGYGWAPGWPWYGLLLVGGVAVVTLALLYAQLRSAGAPLDRRGALRRWLVCVGYCAAVAAVFVVRLQFTAVAGLAAGAGVALWICGRLSPVVPALLLLLGGLLRFDALLLALLLALPLAADRLLRLGHGRALRRLGGLAAVLALAFALHAADRLSYRGDPGWREFLELNAVRARIVDYGAGGGAEGRALEGRLGWSANDAALLRRWFYPDRAVYPIEKLRALVAAAPVARPSAAEAWTRVREAFSYPSLLPLALLLPLLVATGEARERLRTLALTLLPAVLVLTLLAVYMRAPEHVGLPALAFVPTALLATSGDSAGPGRRAWRVALALAAAGILLACRQGLTDSAAVAEENRDLHRSLAMVAAGPQRLLVDWGGAFRYEAVLPLEDTSYLAGLRLYSLGWPQRSPVADRMLEAFAIDDVARALVEREDVALLMNPAWGDSLARYAREHYGARIRFRESTRTPSFTVFRLERDEPEPANAGDAR